MSQKRLLLLSNSKNYDENYLEYPQDTIKSFLSHAVKEVLFIPYAGVGFSYDEYTEKVATPFNSMGYGLKGIHADTDPKSAVEDAEAIAVGGGNTFELLNQLYKNDLIHAIQERVSDGMPFMGWSAGSNVAGPSIKTTNDMPIVEPESFNALNLVPFQINPHYTEAVLPKHGGETRKDRLNEFVALNPDVYVVGIPEGNLIEVIGNKLRLIGPDSIKVFKQGRDIEEFTSADDLNFLLN